MTATRSPQDPNPVNGAPIATCHHKATHTHGTTNGYGTCGCRCTFCRAAARDACANRRAGIRRGSMNDPGAYVPARERSSFGQFQLTPSHLTTNIPGADLFPGAYLSTTPKVDRDTARNAARVVLHHTNDKDAAQLLRILGIKELAA